MQLLEQKHAAQKIQCNFMQQPIATRPLTFCYAVKEPEISTFEDIALAMNKAHNRLQFSDFLKRYTWSVIIFCVLSPLGYLRAQPCSWTWYRDADGDGFGALAETTTTLCGVVAPSGYVANHLDCNDAAVSAPLWYALDPEVLAATGVTPEVVVSTDSIPFAMLVDFNTSRISVLKYVNDSWALVGAKDFSGVLGNNGSASLALDGSTPYVSYADVAGRAVVMKYTSPGWTTVGSLTATSSVTDTDIAIYNSEPYLMHNIGAALYVRRFTAGSWSVLGSTSFGTGVYPRMAMNGAGVPYVVFSDNVVSDRVTVRRFTSSWQNVGTTGFSSDYIDFPGPDISIDGANIPYVTYYNGGEDKVYVQKYTGSWTTVGTDDVHNGQPSDLSLAVDFWSIPYVAYSYGSSYTVKKLSGTSWQAVVSDPLTQETGGVISGEEISLALTAGGIPLVGFVDHNNNDQVSAMQLGAFSCPLPVKLISFNAVAEGSIVNLSWATATENNFDHFSVERSTDGMTFREIDEVPGKGNGTAINRYTFKDHTAPNGRNYYRLRMFDLDGQADHSDIVIATVDREGATPLVVYPNPNTTGRIYYVLGAEPQRDDQVQVINSLGMIVHQEVVQETSENFLDVMLSPGTYIVKYLSGEKQYHARLIVVQ
jgi:hypothetical protein